MPFPTTLLPGLCRPGHSQGNLLSLMSWSSSFQSAVSPNSPSVFDPSIITSQEVCLYFPGSIPFSEEYSLGVGCRNSLIMIFRSISFLPFIGSFLPQGPHCSILGMTLWPHPPPYYKSNGVLTSHRRVI